MPGKVVPNSLWVARRTGLHQYSSLPCVQHRHASVTPFCTHHGCLGLEGPPCGAPEEELMRNLHTAFTHALTHSADKTLPKQSSDLRRQKQVGFSPLQMHLSYRRQPVLALSHSPNNYRKLQRTSYFLFNNLVGFLKAYQHSVVKCRVFPLPINVFYMPAFKCLFKFPMRSKNIVLVFNFYDCKRNVDTFLKQV